jgi:hypothetical protein
LGKNSGFQAHEVAVVYFFQKLCVHTALRKLLSCYDALISHADFIYFLRIHVVVM